MVLCARCDKKLGLRKIEPKSDWQIEGKICTECNRHICKNTSYYDAEYKENEPDFPKEKGTLAVQNFDEKRRILFIAKDEIQFEIPLPSIQKFESVDYTEKSTKKKVTTLGLKDKSTSKHLQITFVGDNGIYSPIFQIKDFESVSRSLNLHIQKYYEELENITPPQLMIDVIKNARAMQFEDLGISEKLIDNSDEIKKIKKYMNQDERILYVTGQEKEKQLRSATNASMIFVTDKRIIIRNTTSLGMKDVIEDMPYDHISSLKLHEGLLSSAIIFNGAGFAEINTVSQASMQRAWGIEEETVIDSIPKKDAKEFVNILREQVEKNGIKHLEFT
ncbi:MAG: PH domain-containing protein, partial [Nitrosopumilus sp.]